MAAGNEEYVEVEPINDEEKASLKASTGYGSTDNVYALLTPTNNNNKKAATPTAHHQNEIHHQSQSPRARLQSQPSLTRRMSSQLLFQVERQKSVVDNIGLTEKVNQFVPDSITQHIPGLNRRKSQLKLTYFCNICFTKYPIEEGFTLRRCQHQFCVECMCGFMTNKIENGVVNLTCFYPCQGSKACGEVIDEEDIHQIVSAETWQKYEKFKSNLDNTYSRQCPYCDHTQIGNPDQRMMTCEKCDKIYCLVHSNAHGPDVTCEEYELSMAKDNRMNEMALKEMGETKPCPQCKYKILKNGGCNHMKCVKCGCSFCWLCMQIIDDGELPQHYKEDGPCKGMLCVLLCVSIQCSVCYTGQQFAGMEGEAPPGWLVCILILCVALFCIPSTALGIVFGCLCFPLVVCCGCTNDDGQRQSLWETMFGCWMIWLILFIVVVAFIPVLVFCIIWEVIRSFYNVLRICLPCLPMCPTMMNEEAA